MRINFIFCHPTRYPIGLCVSFGLGRRFTFGTLAKYLSLLESCFTGEIVLIFVDVSETIDDVLFSTGAKNPAFDQPIIFWYWNCIQPSWIERTWILSHRTRYPRIFASSDGARRIFIFG